MKSLIVLVSIIVVSAFLAAGLTFYSKNENNHNLVEDSHKSYWFVLNRKSGVENLYLGVPGDVNKSGLVRTFKVKTGASWSPTPLPKLVGREYWKIVKKESSAENPDTAPYFLQLDVPTDENWPYGPIPYTECLDSLGNNIQCDWVQPGYFGLHGINGNPFKLSKEDYGSSGCIRHNDEDITYLYNLLDPEKEEIHYYIEDI